MRLPNLPNSQQRLLMLGRTGSGKSVAAVWHLSQKSFVDQPWVVLNHKNESLIDKIPGAHHIDKLDYVPKRPGVYIYHPVPEVDDEAVTNLMWSIHAQENIGVYIDEGYMINPRDHALTALLTQGRSKHIPMIILSQRPSRISRFAVSEADFYQVFHLIDKRDRVTIGEFVPTNLENLMRSEGRGDMVLPPYHSVYFDVGHNQLNIFRPVPAEDVILTTLEDKLMKKAGRKYLI